MRINPGELVLRGPQGVETGALKYEKTLPFLHISETCLLLPELRTEANTAIEWEITGQRAFEGGPGDLIIYEIVS